MSKATLCFVMILCSVIAFAQQQPQWTVIQHVALSQQSQPIPQTTLFTPTSPGIYRLTVYFSGGTGTGTGIWVESLNGTDITGLPLGGSGNLAIFCREANWQWTPPVVISLKPQVPLTYQVSDISASGCQYNLVITVEELL